jgi:Flp pilus assembly protein TadG
MSFVFVGLGFMAFMATTTLAIDVGMFMAARSQAQNAADAGALAGAVALVRNSYTDRTASGPAVQSAISTAQQNPVVGQAPSVAPGDVTFPNDPNGQPTRVQVNVFRTADRNDSVQTLVGGLFGVPAIDITATATAEASPADSMTCVKPFMIPDKWIENSNQKGQADGPWTPDSAFDLVDKGGQPLANPDVYRGTQDPAVINDPRLYTGYTVEYDTGKQLVLRAGTGAEVNPSFYMSWKMPDDVGGNFYRENIANCNTSIISSGQPIIQEPGDKTGPTVQGINDLIAKDPDTTWDTTCNGGVGCVTGSKYATSPRVFPIPLYDPYLYANGKLNGRPADFEVANFLGFYADHVQGNQIYGRITTIVSTVSSNPNPSPNAFPKVIRLVK